MNKVFTRVLLFLESYQVFSLSLIIWRFMVNKVPQICIFFIFSPNLRTSASIMIIVSAWDIKETRIITFSHTRTTIREWWRYFPSSSLHTSPDDINKTPTRPITTTIRTLMMTTAKTTTANSNNNNSRKNNMFSQTIIAITANI